MDVTDLDVIGSQTFGDEGFLVLKRHTVCNVRADGSRSRRYVVDMVDRPRGLDAVVVLAYERQPARVLLRRCMRPVLRLGRSHPSEQHQPGAEAGSGPLFVVEAVAGIVERTDQGEEGRRFRAAAELREEAGLTVDPAEVRQLGPPVFVSAGVIAERLFVYVVQTPLGQRGASRGDGSPMEEGGQIMLLGLEQALELCGRGEIGDLKTECALQRLAAVVR